MTPLLLLLSLSPPARAEQLPTWALVVGSNRPGQGQTALRYAHKDAERMAAVLAELGPVPPQRLSVLADPDSAELSQAIERIEQEIAAAGLDRSRFFFYYSGHARASGLDLGPESLSLSGLRAQLEAVPASSRVLVLDACQSGALSDPKGIHASGVFSTVSVQGFDAQGTVVIASSSADELSQEDEALQGSPFTHHLVVGLRGAADRDADGLVTLDEAYRYAYDRTLLSTAGTRIGRQHPTLDSAIQGRGAMVLTRPEGASARLHLGPQDQGELLLARDGFVVAEVSKVAGEALTLALPPGRYEVVQQQGERAERCELEIAAGSSSLYAPTACRRLREAEGRAKGEAPFAASSPLAETFGLELGIGGTTLGEDAYTTRLQDFSYGQGWNLGLVGSLRLSYSLHRNLGLLASTSSLEAQSWQRSIGSDGGNSNETLFRWRGSRTTLGVRGQLPLARDWLVPYAQVEGGLGSSFSVYDSGEDAPVEQRQWGPAFGGGLGLQLMPSFGSAGWRHLGLFGQVELVHAPVLKNLLGETHDLGGRVITLGLRASF
jgi:hypothetical protein